MLDVVNSMVSKVTGGVTDQQIKDFLATSPSDADIVSAMQTYGVSPTQLANVVGVTPGEVIARAAATIPYGQTAMLGDVVVQPIRDVQGSGENEQVGPVTAINVTKSTGNISDKAPVGSQYQTYAPDGTLQNTGTVQKYDDKFTLGSVLRDIVSNPGFKIGALAYGGNALADALGGAGSAFELQNAGASALSDLGANNAINSTLGSTALNTIGTTGKTAAELAALDLALGGAGGTLGAETLGSALTTGATVPTLTNLTGGSGVLTGAAANITADTVAKKLAGDALGTPSLVTTPTPPIVKGVPGVLPAATALSTLLPLGAGLAASAIGNVAGGVANQAGISDARNLINQYGGQAANSLATAYNNAQGLNAANRTDLGNIYKNTSGNLYDLYSQQVGYQNPYQDIGRAGSQGLVANKDYFQHIFNKDDLTANLAPNYEFQLAQGQMANQRAGNMGGGALGGNALQGLQKYTQDYAGNAYQNAFNNYNTQRNNIYNSLANMANIGTTSAGQLANIGNTYGSNLANLSSNFGGNLTSSYGQGIGAANAYGLNTANLATGIGSALASNATQSGANNASLLSNLGNTALLGSLIKAT